MAAHAVHPAEVYHAAPSARVALVRRRQLTKIAAAHGVQVEMVDGAGAALITALLQQGVALTEGQQDTENAPAGLNSLANEILADILALVVVTAQEGAHISEQPTFTDLTVAIFGNKQKSGGVRQSRGSIHPARASRRLFTIAVSVLLKEDIVHFRVGEYMNRAYINIPRSAHETTKGESVIPTSNQLPGRNISAESVTLSS